VAPDCQSFYYRLFPLVSIFFSAHYYDPMSYPVGGEIEETGIPVRHSQGEKPAAASGAAYGLAVIRHHVTSTPSTKRPHKRLDLFGLADYILKHFRTGNGPIAPGAPSTLVAMDCVC
jgi:hypothetical protein